MTAPMMSDCAGCSREWQHCHGTWIEHAAGVGECSDQAFCEVAPEGHTHVVLCGDVSDRCCRPPGLGG